MIDFLKALDIAKNYLIELGGSSKVELALLENKVVEFGWLFLYQSEKYVRTGNEGALLGGNAPIIVD